MYHVANCELGRQILNDSKPYLNGTPSDDGRIFIEPSKAAQTILREHNGDLPLSPFSTTNGAQHKAYRDVVECAFKVPGDQAPKRRPPSSSITGLVPSTVKINEKVSESSRLK
jgi:hypothetical protein